MQRRIVTTRWVRRDEDDGSFDRAFWRKAGHEARFRAAWEMVAEVAAMRGALKTDGNESRLQRSVAVLRRRGR